MIHAYRVAEYFGELSSPDKLEEKSLANSLVLPIFKKNQLRCVRARSDAIATTMPIHSYNLALLLY